jgi:hypothetical protein
MRSEGLLLVVGQVEEGDPHLALDALQLRLHLLAQLLVERAERLVEQQHRGAVDERPGQRHTLLLAARELARPRLLAPPQLDRLEGLGHPGAISPDPTFRRFSPKATLSSLGVIRQAPAGPARPDRRSSPLRRAEPPCYSVCVWRGAPRVGPVTSAHASGKPPSEDGGHPRGLAGGRAVARVRRARQAPQGVSRPDHRLLGLLPDLPAARGFAPGVMGRRAGKQRARGADAGPTGARRGAVSE